MVVGNLAALHVAEAKLVATLVSLRPIRKYVVKHIKTNGKHLCLYRFQHLVALNLERDGQTRSASSTDGDDDIVSHETSQGDESAHEDTDYHNNSEISSATTPTREKRVIKPKAPKLLAEIESPRPKAMTKAIEKKLNYPNDSSSRKAFRRKQITRTLITYPNGYNNPPEFRQVVEPGFIVEQYDTSVVSDSTPPSQKETKGPIRKTVRRQSKSGTLGVDLDMIEMLIRAAHVANEKVEMFRP